MSRLTLRIDDALDAELVRLAKAMHRSKSDLVREMLRREIAAYNQQLTPTTAAGATQRRPIGLAKGTGELPPSFFAARSVEHE